ncbi:MAG: Xaa-Pro dipeptidase [Gammaproteobacteria bacterium]|nr:Xaa-Pro dipeptidase [Gammaproteobacteria bacterium]
MRRLTLIIGIYCAFISAQTMAESVILNPLQVLNVQTGQLDKTQIMVLNGKITKIGSNLNKNFTDAKIIKLPGMTLMPGMMDAHVHLMGNTDLKGYAGIGQSSQLATIYGVQNAKNTLLAGFTTVRNVGAGSFSDVALKDAINKGVVIGPTLFVSGPALGITGGHCDSNLLPHEYNHQSEGVVDSPWEARKQVRKNRKFGADLIKFCATGGVLSKNTDVNAKQFTLEEMQAIVDEAHNHGMRVAAHAHGLKGIRTAIIAGVDSIEHSSFIDEETIKLAKERGTSIAMDVYVSDYILGEGAVKGILEESLAKERSVGMIQRQNFKKAVEAGANLVFGTDAGIFPHGKNARQFKYMVEWGMTPLQAIQSATIRTAELFDMTDAGEIRENFAADIIGVAGNPLEDITLLENIDFVMKNGKIVKQ